jgi:two-component system NtrC family sensor kinase
MTGRRPSELFAAETARVIEANDERMLARGTYQTDEESYFVGGEERFLVVERFPLTDYKDEPVAICTVGRDVTRSRLLQQELVQSERLAAIGKLAAGVAHELNNPLTGILTFAEDLYLEAADGDPSRDDYQVIMNEAMRCRRIVRDLLDYSRQKVPERKRQALGPVVRRVVTMVERQATFHNVRFVVDVDAAVASVDIDASQIQQALLNLVINARDAMDGCGTITISARVRAEDRTVVVEVADEGCGIAQNELSRVFEPFFTTKGDRGNGLGLPAVRSIAEQHGGHVEVESTVGAGSTFRLVLPAAAN